MINFTIEKNIPLPNGTRSAKYINFPFADMEIGDSFEIPKLNRSAARNSASEYQKKNPGTYFVVKQISEEKYRVWRMS